MAVDRAPPPIVGCGFHFGPISNERAAGTIFYSVLLEPANAAQRCTTAVTFTLKAAPTSGGTYTTIDGNPLTATQTVAFAPGGNHDRKRLLAARRRQQHLHVR